MNRLFWILMLVLGTSYGCAEQASIQDHQPKLSQITSAVYNGRDDFDSTHVVGVVMGPNGENGACSGTLIAPNLVLTAYHCVAEVPYEAVVCGTTRFGRRFAPNYFRIVTDYNSQQANVGYTVQEVFGPNQNPNICGGDIALLSLTNPIPSHIATPVTPRLEVPTAPGEQVSTAGYGLGNDNQYSAGVRRRRDDGVVHCIGCQGVDMGRQEIGATGYTCSGDSGGPLFDRQEQVIGVTSRGPQGCNEETSQGIYTSVYEWRDWIRETAIQVANNSGTRAPAWAGPTMVDADFDNISDDVDNCLGMSNPDQADLDEDGQGDACDAQLNRECSVCEACAQDDECGPGAYCGEDSRCYMTCRTNADCPGGSTTTCQNFGEFSVCVNSSYSEGELCPSNYVCGQITQPAPAPTPPARPYENPQPAPGETNPSEPLECWSPDGSRKGDEFCPNPVQNNGTKIDTPEATPTLNPFADGGCSTFSSSSRPGAVSFLFLILLIALRRLRHP